MLMGLAICAAAVGAAALHPSTLIEAILIVVAFAAWLIGACGMVGYTRWFFGNEIARAKQDAVDEIKSGKK